MSYPQVPRTSARNGFVGLCMITKCRSRVLFVLEKSSREQPLLKLYTLPPRIRRLDSCGNFGTWRTCSSPSCARRFWNSALRRPRPRRPRERRDRAATPVRRAQATPQARPRAMRQTTPPIRHLRRRPHPIGETPGGTSGCRPAFQI